MKRALTHLHWTVSLLAAGLSYATWHSTWWAVVHGCCSWAYLAYWWASR
jgi:hypothetical protein